MSDDKLWVLDVNEDAQVEVWMVPKPFTLSEDDERPPILRLGIETNHDDGSHTNASVDLTARQAWDIGEHLRAAVGAYVKAGGPE
jgi:hypothetical protein